MVHQWAAVVITLLTFKTLNDYTLGDKAEGMATTRAAHTGDCPLTYGVYGPTLMAKYAVPMFAHHQGMLPSEWYVKGKQNERLD